MIQNTKSIITQGSKVSQTFQAYHVPVTKRYPEQKQRKIRGFTRERVFFNHAFLVDESMTAFTIYTQYFLK